jgi:hypothetical protein
LRIGSYEANGTSARCFPAPYLVCKQHVTVYPK